MVTKTTMYTVEPRSYDQAKALMAKLAEAGIRSGETVGGIDIHAEPEQVETMQSICAEFELTTFQGMTDLMARTLSRAESINRWRDAGILEAQNFGLPYGYPLIKDSSEREAYWSSFISQRSKDQPLFTGYYFETLWRPLAKLVRSRHGARERYAVFCQELQAAIKQPDRTWWSLEDLKLTVNILNTDAVYVLNFSEYPVIRATDQED